MMTAIIGHGRSPEGKGWGRLIDAVPTVVRMWDWNWQRLRDYGQRYDWGLIEAYRASHERWLAHNRHEPRHGWIASVLDEKTRRLMPPRTVFVDQEPWRHRGKMLRKDQGPLNLTRGGIAACWAAQRSRPGDVVLLVGFDNVHAKRCLPLAEAFPPEYRAAPEAARFDDYIPHGPNLSRQGHHDYAIEGRIIEAIATERGARVAFAQDVWG